FDREPRQGSYLPQDATRSRSIVAGPGRALTSSEPAAGSPLEGSGGLRGRSGVACTMTPDAWGRAATRARPKAQFQRGVGDAKVQVGFTRQQQHARLDCLEGSHQVTLIERVGADIAVVPGDKLGMTVGGTAARE